MDEADIAAALLADLRALLDRPALAFLEPPSRLTGGFDTQTFGFQLKGTPPDFSGRLVLRAFAPAEGQRARFEAAAQSAIAALGYPAPRALHVSESGGALRLPYLLMPRIEGKPLGAIGVLRSAAKLAGAQAALHALDPAPVRLALEAAGAGPVASGIDDWLKALTAAVEQPGMEPLRPAAEWLRTSRPRTAGHQAVCHLDFHPFNVLAKAGLVTGVIDWANVSFGDPAADVAVTRVILTLAPFDAPAWLEPLSPPLRRLLAWRYTQAYRKLRPLRTDSLRYYEAWRCFTAMSHLSQMRIAGRTGAPLQSSSYAWAGAATIQRVTAHFRQITGVELGLAPGGL